ncbi:MAG: 16S rRNA (uracil(1498)-N(3))-methyltransferase [Pseudomonadota bacterium]
MPAVDFRTQRLFIDTPLAPNVSWSADRSQANYLLNVLRLRDGAPLLVFNGRDGEWQARIGATGRKACTLTVERQTRPQTPPNDLTLLFAPIKRLEYAVQKAVEMGAGRIVPVITAHTQVRAPKREKMRAYVLEACEQCGVIAVPELMAPTDLTTALTAVEANRAILFCDERAEVQNPVAALETIPANTPLAVLIGPEGGFNDVEREGLMADPRCHALALGPRILRADTALVAALGLIQASRGDW